MGILIRKEVTFETVNKLQQNLNGLSHYRFLCIMSVPGIQIKEQRYLWEVGGVDILDEAVASHSTCCISLYVTPSVLFCHSEMYLQRYRNLLYTHIHFVLN